MLVSITARRESTTLLRLRSSLITLNSRVLPSMWLVSFTGRVSTREPGRKARIPLVMTVRPPFTLPVTVPVISSDDSRAFSRLSQAARRLARSRESRVSPRPSSKASMATEIKSPSLTSSSPWSFINSSTGIKLSDFRPALTTTWFWSIRITSAVITSPARISCRETDSANIAANDSGASAPIDVSSDINEPFQEHIARLRRRWNYAQMGTHVEKN